jgi:hypothetical protein
MRQCKRQFEDRARKYKNMCYLPVFPQLRYQTPMNDIEEPSIPEIGESQRRRKSRDQSAQRQERAAAKLRENLLRRKTQARARRAGDADETDGLPAAKAPVPDQDADK